MNWYLRQKTAAMNETLPYFEQFEDDEFMPDPNQVRNHLQQNFQTEIDKPIAAGDSGYAYYLKDGNVLKVTSNAQEAKVAQWLIKNPHPNIARYINVWNQKGLWYVLMQHVNTQFKGKGFIKRIEKFINEAKCHDVRCAFQLLSQIENVPYVPQIKSVLWHLSKIENVNPFDFLNANNIGTSDGGDILFFDIT
jgi:hypothetical protein